MATDLSDRVFNQTGRREIPRARLAATFDPDAGVITVTRLTPEDWYEHLRPGGATAAHVHFDVTSRLFHQRTTAGTPTEVIRPDWAGVRIELPREVAQGEQRITLGVTVALPPDGAEGGLIVAKLEPVGLTRGGNGPGTDDNGVRSALKVRPSSDLGQEPWGLDLDDPDGPTVTLNSRLPGDWQAFARQPLFRLGILPSVLRAVYFHLALHRDAPPPWAETWLGLPGAQGLREEMAELDATSPEAVGEMQQWASRVSGAVSTEVAVIDRMIQSLEDTHVPARDADAARHH